MLRILYSSKLFPYSDPHFSFVAWSFGMRSNQFPSYTQRGTQQRWILHMLSKEDIQGVGKALNGGGICLWHDLLGKLEPMWIYRRSSLKCSISAFIMGERCSLQRPKLHPRYRGRQWENLGTKVQGLHCQYWFHLCLACDLEWVMSQFWAFISSSTN